MKSLHERFGASLEILCFPSDEFGGQEIGSDQIADFVGKSFGLQTEPGFRIMAKCAVNGASAHPVWQLAKKAFPGEVRWNFAALCLFDKSGACTLRTSLQQPPTPEQIQALM